jgi:hypothetical protein
MQIIQIGTVAEPFSAPKVFELACALIARAQVMGFLPPDLGETVRLDGALISEIADELQHAGVAEASAARLHRAGNRGKADLIASLKATVEAVDASPLPDGEWANTREILGDELLRRALGGISLISLRRYASGERATPDPVAHRLHLIARILSSLVGSYNYYGVRRWFERPRVQLDGVAPIQLLEVAGDDEDDLLAPVIALADSLLAAASGA